MLVQSDRRTTTTTTTTAVLKDIRFKLEWNMYDTLSEGKKIIVMSIMHYYSYRRGNIYLVDIYLVHTKYIKNVCGQRSNPFKLFHPAEMRQPVFHRLDCL